MISSLGLVILNRHGNEYTFQGARGRSNVDVTLASPNMLSCIRDWRVVKGCTTSDHLIISFVIAEQIDSLETAPVVRYRDNKICKPTFVEAVRNELNATSCDGSINGAADQISQSLSAACDKCLPKVQINKQIRPPWWNPEVTSSRRALKVAHRSMLRMSTPDTKLTFKAARNKHVSNIRKAKKLIWQKFAEDPLVTGKV